jgi:hypothetical protein
MNCNPDGARRNPGYCGRCQKESRITLRYMRATRCRRNDRSPDGAKRNPGAVSW